MNFSNFNFIREVESKVFVTWMDNYNAKWRMKMANIGKDNFKIANWTGVAVREYTGQQEIHMNCLTQDDGTIIPALPDNMFQHIAPVTKFIINHTEAVCVNDSIPGLENFPFEKLEQSLLNSWGVHRLPLKPNLDNEHVPRKYKEAIEAAPDTLANFYPKGVFRHNIGSNEGCVAMLKEYFDEFVKNNYEKKYFVITCDENIYKRAMRVHIFFRFS